MNSFENQLYKKMSAIIKKRHCILRSGKHSDTYIAKTEITLDPTLYLFIIKSLTQAITSKFSIKSYDVITGPAVAGICFAAPVALNIGKPFIFPEKLEHRSPSAIEGSSYDLETRWSEMVFRDEYREFVNGKKVLIIEDIVTTSNSIAKTASAIRSNGGTPMAAVCIWLRDPSIDNVLYSYYNQNQITSKSNESIMPLYCLLSKEVKSWPASECECIRS